MAVCIKPVFVFTCFCTFMFAYFLVMSILKCLAPFKNKSLKLATKSLKSSIVATPTFVDISFNKVLTLKLSVVPNGTLKFCFLIMLPSYYCPFDTWIIMTLCMLCCYYLCVKHTF
ncbi:hypothetical protein NP493_411g00008 [Ridgeia piscesae]|uniref:Uncharacterized protein n=1 Tax=Ridgeia piscesae TaxID=27915 RepID=A0AAD9NUF6_RIDPI|nr:hypothetical protein NP493_411g00008 [Ridgeia piscesae]